MNRNTRFVEHIKYLIIITTSLHILSNYVTCKSVLNGIFLNSNSTCKQFCQLFVILIYRLVADQIGFSN